MMNSGIIPRPAAPAIRAAVAFCGALPPRPQSPSCMQAWEQQTTAGELRLGASNQMQVPPPQASRTCMMQRGKGGQRHGCRVKRDRKCAAHRHEGHQWAAQGEEEQAKAAASREYQPATLLCATWQLLEAVQNSSTLPAHKAQRQPVRLSARRLAIHACSQPARTVKYNVNTARPLRGEGVLTSSSLQLSSC